MSLFYALFGNSEKELNRAFKNGYSSGLSEGIEIGMKRHFEATSELSEKENELLIQFLVKNNFVLCYNLHEGGFRVRKNNIINAHKESNVIIVSNDYVESPNFKYFVEKGVELENIQLSIDEFRKQSKTTTNEH